MGFSFSAGDVQTFKQFPLPDKATCPHAYRWYIHIAALQVLLLLSSLPPKNHDSSVDVLTARTREPNTLHPTPNTISAGQGIPSAMAAMKPAGPSGSKPAPKAAKPAAKKAAAEDEDDDAFDFGGL